jgi:hypothetical protein
MLGKAILECPPNCHLFREVVSLTNLVLESAFIPSHHRRRNCVPHLTAELAIRIESDKADGHLDLRMPLPS